MRFPDAALERVAAGGVAGHTFVACALSSGELAVRHDAHGTPLLQHLTWPWGATKRVVGLAFDAAAQWLVAVADDLTVAVVPLHFLLKASARGSQLSNEEEGPVEPAPSQEAAAAGAGPSPVKFIASLLRFKDDSAAPAAGASTAPSPFERLTGVSVLRGFARPRAHARECVWWQSGRRNVCITSYNNASVGGGNNAPASIINSSSSGATSTSTAAAAAAAAAADDDGSTGLLFIDLHTQRALLRVKLGGVLEVTRLCVMRGEPNDTLFVSTTTDAFRIDLAHDDAVVAGPPRRLRNVSASLHTLRKPVVATVLAHYDSTTRKLLIREHATAKFPTYAYQLPSPASQVVVTDRFVLAAHHNSLSVVSCLFSGTTETAQMPLKSRNALMQVLFVSDDSGGSIIGVLPEVAPLADALPGCLFWTMHGVFQCMPRIGRSRARLERAFLDYVAVGLEAKQAEPLGKACALDVLGLFKIAAERAFEQRQYGRALELYLLAEVETMILVQRFLAIGRLDVVISHVSSMLRSSARSLEASRHARTLATLLVLCRMHACVEESARDGGRAAINWDAVLAETSGNTHIDVEVVVRAALSCGAVMLALRVAHSRGDEELAHLMRQLRDAPPESSLLPLQPDEELFVAEHSTSHAGAADSHPLPASTPPMQQVLMALVGLSRMHALPLADRILVHRALLDPTQPHARVAELYMDLLLRMLLRAQGVEERELRAQVSTALRLETATGEPLHRLEFVAHCAMRLCEWRVACTAHARLGHVVLAMFLRAKTVGLRAALDAWIVRGVLEYDGCDEERVAPVLSREQRLQCLWRALGHVARVPQDMPDVGDWLLATVRASPLVADMVKSLLLAPPAPAPPRDCPLVVPGLPVTAIAAAAMQTSAPGADGAVAVSASAAAATAHLWDSVSSNLGKDVNRDEWVQSAAVAGSARGGAVAVAGLAYCESGVGVEDRETDLVVFSCGHVLPRPQFAAGPHGSSLSSVAAQVVAAEYRCVPSFLMACKKCASVM